MRAQLDAPIRTSATVLDRLLRTGLPALVVFETPGCGPCEQLRPALDKVAGEFHGRVLVIRVVDSAQGWLAARYHLSFVPTLLFWRGAEEQCRRRPRPPELPPDGRVPAGPGRGPAAHAGRAVRPARGVEGAESVALHLVTRGFRQEPEGPGPPAVARCRCPLPSTARGWPSARLCGTDQIPRVPASWGTLECLPSRSRQAPRSALSRPRRLR
jgi:thiol-disulfide isomerase/thioredoxin